MIDSGPAVGVFYFLNDRVYARSQSLSALSGDTTGTGEGMVSFSTHFSFWNTLRTTTPEWATKDDSYFPRGRVLYKTDQDLFILRMDRCIPMSAVATIIGAFNLSNLSTENLHVVHGADPDSGDDHYQCAGCGPHTRRRVL